MRPRPDDKDDKTAKDDAPLLPEQSAEESGIGWGEAPEPDDDERLRSERPPHWDE